MQIRRLAMMLFCTLPMAALLYGCGSSSKEGSSALSDVATVPESQCIGCHSGQYRAETLTGDIIVDKYIASKHNQNFVGCQDCHGGGAQHNGVGPLPYAKPGSTQCAACHTTTTPAFVAGNHGPTNFTLEFAEDEAHRKCSRCHSHEGALIGNMTGFTGDADTLTANADKAPGLDPDGSKTTGMKCVTCHTTHKTEDLRTPNTVDGTGAVVTWQPSKTVGAADPSTNKQFNLCTSCHTYTKPDGTLVASGNNGTAKFYHNTAWYRVIPTTHYDNPATVDSTTAGQVVIEGYVLRTNTANPCFDCHGHEAMTNTRQNTTPVRPSTIYTDWAKSGHAGGLLGAKYTAAKDPVTGAWKSNTAALVDSVMAAGSTGADYAWGHYPWQQAGRQACQKCHTATGASNFLTTSVTDYTQYNAANNNFSHLKLDGSSRGQQELLYCWGCHSNAGKGVLRNTTKAVLDFTYQSQPIVITDAGKSTACVTCHGGRGNVESPRSTRFQGHHAPTAGFMYNEKTHMGYEYAGKDYTNATTHFKHDTIGAGDAGPCASCHMGNKSHSFAAVTEASGAITAINNQTLCNTCHTVGTAYEMTAAKLEEEKTGYMEASTILNNYVSNLAGYNNYLSLAITSSNYSDTVAVPDNAYGAYQNGKISGDEPGAYVHNRTYVKRLIFDSIDWMDNGRLDGTITLTPAMVAAYPEAAVWLKANATTGIATRP